MDVAAAMRAWGWPGWVGFFASVLGFGAAAFLCMSLAPTLYSFYLSAMGQALAITLTVISAMAMAAVVTLAPWMLLRTIGHALLNWRWHKRDKQRKLPQYTLQEQQLSLSHTRWWATAKHLPVSVKFFIGLVALGGALLLSRTLGLLLWDQLLGLGLSGPVAGIITVTAVCWTALLCLGLTSTFMTFWVVGGRQINRLRQGSDHLWDARIIRLVGLGLGFLLSLLTMVALSHMLLSALQPLMVPMAAWVSSVTVGLLTAITVGGAVSFALCCTADLYVKHHKGKIPLTSGVLAVHNVWHEEHPEERDVRSRTRSDPQSQSSAYTSSGHRGGVSENGTDPSLSTVGVIGAGVSPGDATQPPPVSAAVFADVSAMAGSNPAPGASRAKNKPRTGGGFLGGLFTTNNKEPNPPHDDGMELPDLNTDSDDSVDGPFYR